VRESAVRLAMRCRDRALARPVRPRRRRRDPARDRGRAAAAGGGGSDAPAAWPGHPTDGPAQGRDRPADPSGGSVLESGEEIASYRSAGLQARIMIMSWPEARGPARSIEPDRDPFEIVSRRRIALHHLGVMTGHHHVDVAVGELGEL